jgi:heme a synthase
MGNSVLQRRRDPLGRLCASHGSGAGCGEQWPLCRGDILTKTPQAQTVIEFTHRMTSGLALIMVASLMVWCWRKTSSGEWPRYSAVLATILLLTEAFLGALLVVFDHIAQDRSAGRALFLSLHFGNTLLLLASLALAVRWLSHGDRHFVVTRKPSELIAVGLGLIATMCIGIAGSLAALGDTIFPAASLRSSLIHDFSSGGHGLLHVRLLHPIAAAISAFYFLWLILKSSGNRVRSPQTFRFLAGMFVLQAGFGVMNVILLAPVWLQIVHLLVADLFWILLVLASPHLLLENATLYYSCSECNANCELGSELPLARPH